MSDRSGSLCTNGQKGRSIRLWRVYKRPLHTRDRNTYLKKVMSPNGQLKGTLVLENDGDHKKTPCLRRDHDVVGWLEREEKTPRVRRFYILKGITSSVPFVFDQEVHKKTFSFLFNSIQRSKKGKVPSLTYNPQKKVNVVQDERTSLSKTLILRCL